MTQTAALTRHAYWLDVAFQRNLSADIHEAQEALRDIDFDTVVCTGLSGTLVAPILWRALDVPYLAVVRKQEIPETHSDNAVEGAIGARWLFVDDFVSTGRTRRRVLGEVDRWAKSFGHDTEFVGTYQYGPRKFDDPTARRWSE